MGEETTTKAAADAAKRRSSRHSELAQKMGNKKELASKNHVAMIKLEKAAKSTCAKENASESVSVTEGRSKAATAKVEEAGKKKEEITSKEMLARIKATESNRKAAIKKLACKNCGNKTAMRELDSKTEIAAKKKEGGEKKYQKEKVGIKATAKAVKATKIAQVCERRQQRRK